MSASDDAEDVTVGVDKAAVAGSVVAVVGFLAFVEFTSGIIQGYYTPLYTDIARFLKVPDADVNWLEGTQLMLSAIVVPVFAKLGDMFGHKKMLLITTGVTAVAAMSLTFAHTFGSFLVAWTFMGAYVAWLPLEIALIWFRSRGREKPAAITRLAAGVLVAALELGAIAGALIAGALSDSGWSVPALLWCRHLAVVRAEDCLCRQDRLSLSVPVTSYVVIGEYVACYLLRLPVGLSMGQRYGYVKTLTFW